MLKTKMVWGRIDAVFQAGKAVLKIKRDGINLVDPTRPWVNPIKRFAMSTDIALTVEGIMVVGKRDLRKKYMAILIPTNEFGKGITIEQENNFQDQLVDPFFNRGGEDE